MFTQYIFVILCLSQVVSCGGCSNFACTSTLRKTLLPPSAAVQIPLLGAEVDVLMQRRNTKVGNMYSTYDELYNERLTQNAICGRADVEAAIKNIQRFTLQRKLLYSFQFTWNMFTTESESLLYINFQSTGAMDGLICH